MYESQRQVLESFFRVRAFLHANPSRGRLTYGKAQEMLDEVLARLRTHAGRQVSGQAQRRAASRRQRDLVDQLRTGHMRPIVSTARAQVDPGSDVGIPAGFRMPRGKVRVSTMLELADAMIALAARHESLFVQQGLPPDFLARFAAARDQLARSVTEVLTHRGTHIEARIALRVELVRGRLAVDRLDAIVRASFRGDEAVLAAWKAAKRVHRLPGGAAATKAAEPAAAPVEVPSASQAAEPVPAPVPTLGHVEESVQALPVVRAAPRAVERFHARAVAVARALRLVA